jgi:hypothetical protein
MLGWPLDVCLEDAGAVGRVGTGRADVGRAPRGTNRRELAVAVGGRTDRGVVEPKSGTGREPSPAGDEVGRRTPAVDTAVAGTAIAAERRARHDRANGRNRPARSEASTASRPQATINPAPKERTARAHFPLRLAD